MSEWDRSVVLDCPCCGEPVTIYLEAHWKGVRIEAAADVTGGEDA